VDKQWRLPRDQCKHRYETRFNQNPFIANTYLRKALRRYELLHTNAINSMNIVDDLLETDPNKVKYKYILADISHCGLNNRLISIISLYLISLLTDRILLIYSDSFGVDEIFCQAFEYSDWIFPVTVPWDSIKNLALNSPCKAISYSEEPFTHHVSTEDIVATNHHWKDTQILHFFNGEHYFVPLLFANPYLKEKLHFLFPSLNVATTIGTYLFHPRDYLWDEILETYYHLKTISPVSAPLVGIQFRHGFKDATQPEVQCIPTANNSFGHQQPWPKNTAVFISSMYPITLNDFHLNGFLDAEWNVYQRYADLHESHELNATVHALHDVWLLSMTDVTILSHSSTFDYMAAAFKGSAGYYGYNHKMVSCEPPHQISSFYPGYANLMCSRPVSHEPEYIGWMPHREIEEIMLKETDTFMRATDMCQFNKKNGITRVGWQLIARNT
jgi:hypothetical protein